jgi:cyclophilin family peptidyl-prolyl cis-trans isomerase
VRAALGETVGRLPYSADEDIGRAEDVLLSLGSSEAVLDRLGAAKGFEALIRRNGNRRAPSASAVAVLRALVGVRDGTNRDVGHRAADSVRDVRVRRLALAALTSAGAADAAVIQLSAIDPDPQVRRLAMRAALSAADHATLAAGLGDVSPLVRHEALGAIGSRGGDAACTSPLAALADDDVHVTLLAIDLLGACGNWPQAALVLEDMAKEEGATAPRKWPRAAHAIVALAQAAPERARVALGPFTASARGPARVYAARAAGILADRTALRALAGDTVEAAAATAIDALARHREADDEALFVAALSGRPGVVRAAAEALRVSRQPDVAVTALRGTLARLRASHEPGAFEAAAVVSATLTALDAAPPADKPTAAANPVSPERLRRLAAPRARIQIKDVGIIELALITTEAPATVLRFAELAESGYYDGLTFHEVRPNTLAQGGSPGADDHVGSPGPAFRDEVGTWPHVRGTLGMAADGRHTGRGQFFINLVDNPQFDHERTVFGQILNGIEVIDRIVEGDVIERIEIMP